jgi:hypothetical protein
MELYFDVFVEALIAAYERSQTVLGASLIAFV